MQTQRLAAIDVFRGLTIAGMLLVNDPGDPGTVYAPLRHSVWHGWTPTDLIFPFFVFVVGITTSLSLQGRAERGDDERAIRRQVLRRAAWIFGLGLLLNWFPFYQSGAIPGHPAPSLFDRIVERLYHLRFLGVLQRIALAYLAAALLTWRASARRVIGMIAGLLFGYWAMMMLLPVPGEGAIGALLLHDRSRNLSAWFDRLTLDWTRWGLGNHIWSDSITYDPEGLLSTLPAVATAMLGVLAGRWIAAHERALVERLTGLFAAGALAIMLGLMWNWSFPINKPIWSSSYVLFTAGVACIALGTVGWLVDVVRLERWARPFLVYGTNAIVAYVGAELLAHILHSSVRWKVGGHWTPTELVVTRGFVALGLAPETASLAWALLYVALWYVILTQLYRRRIFVRI